MTASIETLARQLGISLDESSITDVSPAHTHFWLRDFVKLIERIEPRFESLAAACDWSQSEPLSGFSDKTAIDLLRCGDAELVFSFIDAVDAGVFA